MNPLPDAFEWKLMRRSLMVLCVFFVVTLLAAVASQMVPGQARYPKGDLILSTRLIGILTAALAFLVAGRLSSGSDWLFPLALLTVGFNFIASMGTMFWADGNQVVNQAAFLVNTTLYLFLFSFFTRHQWTTLLLGLALGLLGIAVFIWWPTELFHQEFSPEELAGSMNVILGFGIPMVTFLVFLNNQISASLMTRAREAVAKLERLAYYDGETELPNGTQLEKDISDWRPDTLGSDVKLVLAGFRLEGVDALNELKGLEFTTKMIQRIAQSYSNQLTHGLEENPSFRGPKGWHTMYRIEGVTFVFPFTIPPGTKPDTSPMQVLLDSVLREENERLLKGATLQFHGGFTVFPDDTRVPNQLVGNLLNLLHSHRSSGMGYFVPFNASAYSEFLRREAVRTSLVDALANGEFFVVFQPKVRLSDGALVGFESLARWISPILGVVSPDEFIQIAEQSVLIEQITVKILNDTLDFVRRLRSKGLEEFRVSINLSPGLLSGRFLGSLERQLSSSGLARHLELEITEGILLVLDPAVQGHFRKLRTLGTTFAIDDFGTGYSNLGYLQSFEAEVLKIDKRFIDGIPHDEKNTKLVRAILQMAQSFGMKVVAEGVEYQEQRSFLLECGCDQIQGYFYSKPLRADDALSFPHNVD